MLLMCVSVVGNLAQPRSEDSHHKTQTNNNNNQTPQMPEFIQVPNFKSSMKEKKKHSKNKQDLPEQ